MTSYLKKLIVEPGSKVKLNEVDPSYHGDHDSHDAAMPEFQANLAKMDDLQYLMYAERKHSLLVVLQGLDAGGKDGVVRHVITGMNPAGVRVVGFKQPTAEEIAHDFLWRVHPHAPRKGEVVVFNRSHYEDVLVVRVHDLVSKPVWSERYELINDFEKLLAEQNGTTILKFFLYISKEEQLERFKQRLDDPARQWKISDSDYSERNYWDDYIAAFEDALEKTSKKHAPWFIIPANHKWFRNLAISQIIVETLNGLKMKTPAPTVDITAIRKQYHAAAEAMRDNNK
ncbi:MAG: polyphosphate kinase 2 family protein [Planctomycetes bacterium]|nr:polyphosphate kinase 2 family protein [Planctomycetota bacterium]